MTCRRRRVLVTLSGTLVAVAGCLDTGGDDSGRDTRGSESDAESDARHEADSDNTAEGTEADIPVPNDEFFEFPPADEPASAPERMTCGVCNMTPADWPDSNAQAVHDDGHRQFFCSPGCLVAYRAAVTQFSVSNTPIVHSWARDVDTKGLHRVDGETFHWVLDSSSDPERGIDPMSNPLPYTDRDDALAYVEQWSDLSADDIVRTADLDREIAREYRAVE